MLQQVVLLLDLSMKVLIFLLIFVIGITLVDESYGQSTPFPHEDPSLVQVSLQLQLRNSEGQLITYIEPSRTSMYIVNINMVHEFLDTKENKKIIEKDGETFEVIKYEQLFRFYENKQYATLAMVYKNTEILLFRHDAYLSEPGDTLDAFWKIVRTIQ